MITYFCSESNRLPVFVGSNVTIYAFMLVYLKRVSTVSALMHSLMFTYKVTLRSLMLHKHKTLHSEKKLCVFLKSIFLLLQTIAELIIY